MLTAARMVAGLTMAGVAYLVSWHVKTLIAEGVATGYLAESSALIGFLCGWIILGPRAGRGWAAAIGNGITGVAALVFWVLLLQGIYHMYESSMKGRYRSLMDAFNGVIEFMLNHVQYVLDTNSLTMLGIGVLFTGILTEMAARNWR